ncbi:MAG: hypothetical protein RI637_02790 [Acidimicrobiia bacterium]|nr:hypothetical protein [Acidimicrobiia bacterium]
MKTPAVVGVAALMLISCSATSTSPTTGSPPPTTAAPVTSTTVPGPLSPSRVFAAVSPALAFVEPAIGTGSGILRGAKLLTNAHVVWP